MNIFNKVTLQSLKKNRMRTIVTIIGIILSTAMICAVTTFVSSIYNYVYDNAVYMYGDWHGSLLGADSDMYEKVNASKEVKKTVYAQQLGYAVAEGCANDYKPYIYVIGAAEGFKESMPVHITSGNYPANSDEILLPNHLAENGKVIYKVGDTLKLELGDRVCDGEKLNQNNELIYEFVENDESEESDESEEEVVPLEEIKINKTRTYKVVGFYERPGFEQISAPGYTAITVMDEKLSASVSYDVYFKMKNAGDYYDYVENNDLEAVKNRTVLQYSGATGYENIDGMVYGFIAIIVGLIMFGSVALIYNAFSISVSERTKQFGLLSSVGATKKQLRRMVFSEALMVSVIGIPLGILSGIGGIGVTLLIIGSRFTLFFDYPIPMGVHVSPMAVIIAVVIALVTVMISAWIPSKRATKVSAVEAIRQNVDINVKGRQVKTSKLTYKLFGLPGTLASKYYKRSRKKYRATVASLFMSIVLFVATFSFTDYMVEMVNITMNVHGYDISCSKFAYTEKGVCKLPEDMKKETAELFDIINGAEEVTDVVSFQKISHMLLISSDDLTKGAKKYLERYDFTGEYDGLTKDGASIVPGNIYFVQDDVFETFLIDNGLDKEKFMNPDKPLAIAFDGCSEFNAEIGKYETFNYFENKKSEITISVQKPMEGYVSQSTWMNDNGEHYWIYSKEGVQISREMMATALSKEGSFSDDIVGVPYDEGMKAVSLEVGSVHYERPYYIDRNSKPVLVYPESAKDNIYGNGVLNCNFSILSDNHSVSYKDIEKGIQEGGCEIDHLYDYAQMVEEDRSVILIMQVFCYGFIVLISLIAAANVFNTISTNVSLRQRDFAMLKSVGMTAKGFNKMMNYECLLYGTKALLFGMPVALILSYLIWMVVSEGYGMEYMVPWTAIGIAVLSVFIVVFATMMYSMSKIKKENPIDALKNENL